jgi:hypothetical protein
MQTVSYLHNMYVGCSNALNDQEDHIERAAFPVFLTSQASQAGAHDLAWLAIVKRGLELA